MLKIIRLIWTASARTQTLAQCEEYHADYVMILQPTSPFRSAGDIDSAISIAQDTSCDAVVSVSESSVSLPKYIVSLASPKSTYVHSLPNLTMCVDRTSLVYTAKMGPSSCKDHFHNATMRKRVGSIFSDDARAYVMPRGSLDIDEPYTLSSHVHS